MKITEETRRESHKAVNKPSRQLMIMNTLRGKRMTARQIADALGFHDLNAVRPRLTELCSCGCVAAVDTCKDEVTERCVAVYEVVDSA